MSRDKFLGGVILLVSVVIAVIYVYWLLLTPSDLVWFGMPVRWWALAVPMLIAVLGVLFILGWIGYTLATTPTPETIEELEESEKPEEEEKKKKESE